MDGLEEKIKGNMEGLKDDLKTYMGVLKIDTDTMNVKLEGLKNLLQERIPSGDKVIYENHDGEKGKLIMI